jgi:hypothetical protein
MWQKDSLAQILRPVIMLPEVKGLYEPDDENLSVDT